MSYLFGIVFVVWAIAQFIAGYDGIVAYAGIGWAIAAIVISLVFRFTLPITVGAFYGAMTVWGWPWYYALLFSAPGLALIVPSILMSILGSFKRDSSKETGKLYTFIGIVIFIVISVVIYKFNEQTHPIPVTITKIVNKIKTAPLTNAKTDVIAVVNGQYIAKSTLLELEKEIAKRSEGKTFPKEKLIEELIQRELLVQDALQNKLDKTTEFIAQSESAQRTLLTQLDVNKFSQENPVTETEVKTEYESKVAAENGIEYKARHILVKTKDEANQLITELDRGVNFSKLANKYSLDAKESQNGGDLGWFVAGQMVAPFSEAVKKLNNGKYTHSPVKTQFGYHLILREDSRAQTPASFDSVKEKLIPYLQRKKIQTMVETLRKQANIEILVPLNE